MSRTRDCSELIEQQRRLAREVITRDEIQWPPRRIAAVDAAFPRDSGQVRAAAVLMDFPSMEPVSQQVAQVPVTLPYIPGLLSFRELPAILQAIDQLPEQPDVVLCDGQGLAHPRRFGIACHLGVATGLATVGVGKSRLCGEFSEPGLEKGDCAPLMDGQDRIGMVVRTRSHVRPLFVSAGHRLSLETAVRLVLETTSRYRLPDPIRAADRLAGQSSATCSR